MPVTTARLPERTVSELVERTAVGPSSSVAFRAPAWTLISAAWLVPAILAMVDEYMQARLDNAAAPGLGELAWRGGDWLIYGALTPVVFLIAHRFPLREGVLARHVTLHFLISLVFCAAWAGAGVLLRRLLVAGPGGAVTMSFTVRWFFVTLPYGVAVYFSVLGIAHATYYFRAVRERETQAARLTAQLAEARLGALRMQLHPHFLFNSLNAIGVLVRDQDTAAAARMVELLSDVLRQVLNASQVQETTLDEELTFVRNYLAIEQVRFADRLRVTVDVEPALLSAMVPAFVLQPIIENAMRHGIAKRSDAGLLGIAARREGDDTVMVVSDDGPGPGPRESREPGGVGVANTRARLATLFGDRAGLTLESGPGGGARVTIRFPYRVAPASAGRSNG
jgi:two-component system, LytTR family, sensor kinase